MSDAADLVSTGTRDGDEWDGQPCAGQYLALFVVTRTDSTDGVGDVPVLAAASNGTTRCVIAPGRLGAFLRLNRDAVIACHDAGATHWSVARYLQDTSDTDTLMVLWRFSRTMRLVDLGLLDQLLAAAQGDQQARYRTLEELAAAHDRAAPPTVQRLRALYDATAGSTRRDAVRSLNDAAVAVADVVWTLFRALSELAWPIIADLKDRADYVGRFGPLSLGVQVQGMIAAAYARRRGLRPRLGAIPDLRAACQALSEASSQRLQRSPDARVPFRWDGELIKEDKVGLPDRDRKKIRAWLEQFVDDTPALYHPPFCPPRKENGAISDSPDDWGDQVLFDPSLQAWSELWAAASIRKAFDELEDGGDRRLRPQYDVLPRLRSTRPNLVQYRSLLKVGAFEADPAHVLVMGRLDNLVLRCHAELCERAGGQSQLGGLFRDTAYWRAAQLNGELGGQVRVECDPTVFVAWRLHSLECAIQGRAELLWETFAATDEESPETFARWNTAARVMLDVVLRGLGPTHVRDLLRRDLHLEPQGAETLVDEFLDSLRDLGWPVALDDTFEVVRGKLDCEPHELAKLVIAHDSETAAAALRNLIAGRSESPGAFTTLRRICRNEYWKNRLDVDQGSDDLYQDLFARYARSPLGRVRRGVFLSKAQMAEHVDFAEDVRKRVLYELVASGYDLLAFADDEFVVQLRRGELARKIEEIATLARREAAPLFRVTDFVPFCRVEQVDVW